MEKALYQAFNEEVHRYRNSLVYYAKKCDWDAFKVKAGSLFDYCESVERSETERRFMRVFGGILGLLFLIVAVFFRIEPNSPELWRIKQAAMMVALTGGCYEIYFFLTFRLYRDYKMALYKVRRERFIHTIERDFRENCIP